MTGSHLTEEQIAAVVEGRIGKEDPLWRHLACCRACAAACAEASEVLSEWLENRSGDSTKEWARLRAHRDRLQNTSDGNHNPS